MEVEEEEEDDDDDDDLEAMMRAYKQEKVSNFILLVVRIESGLTKSSRCLGMYKYGRYLFLGRKVFSWKKFNNDFLSNCRALSLFLMEISMRHNCLKYLLSFFSY